LAALVAEQAARLADQVVLIEALRVELVALRRQVGRDSSNSSRPPSTDGPAAKAKGLGRQPRRSPDEPQQAPDEHHGGEGTPGRVRRKQGGQPGHRGSGLSPVTRPDKRELVEPSGCAGCGGGLADAPGRSRPGCRCV
jgi:hypothetical protein